MSQLKAVQNPQPAEAQQNLPAVIGNVQTLQKILEEDRGGQMIAAAATRLMPEGLLRKQAYLAVTRDPKLLGCSSISFLRAISRASQLGLAFGTGDEAAIVPFKTEAVLIPRYKGLCKLARRNGEVSRIEAHAVHEADEFEIAFGVIPVLVHSPCITGDPGPVRCFYAIATLKDGSVQMDLMSKAEVDRIRARSAGGKAGPWLTDFVEMGRKTVLKRLCKTLPSASELGDVGADEDDLDRTQLDPMKIPGMGQVDQTTGEVSDSASTGNTAPLTLPTGGEEASLAGQRIELLDRVRELLIELAPGEGADVHEARGRIAEEAFGHKSWSRLQTAPIDFLKPGLAILEGRLVEAGDPIGEQRDDPDDQGWLS